MLPYNAPSSDPLLQEVHLDCPGQGHESPVLWIERSFGGPLGSLHTHCHTHTPYNTKAATAGALGCVCRGQGQRHMIQL